MKTEVAQNWYNWRTRSLKERTSDISGWSKEPMHFIPLLSSLVTTSYHYIFAGVLCWQTSSFSLTCHSSTNTRMPKLILQRSRSVLGHCAGRLQTGNRSRREILDASSSWLICFLWPVPARFACSMSDIGHLPAGFNIRRPHKCPGQPGRADW